MSDKFRNRYRIESNRLRRWDYSSPGYYFITLVTQNRVCNLGRVVEENYVELSDFGKITDAEWHKSFEIRSELFLDEYIIMPNHIHAIVVLEVNIAAGNFDMDGVDNIETHRVVNVETHGVVNVETRTMDNVETHGRASLPQNQIHQPQNQSFHRLPKSISSFLAGFKSAVNTKIDDYIDEYGLDIPKYNRNNHFFQPNYHDHIIRDEQSYQKKVKYIKDNPSNWEKDIMNDI